MVDINDFPTELRWKIATKSASTLSLIQEKLFKELLGQDYKKIQPLTDTINYIFWIQGGKDASNLSKYLGLPTKTPEEIDKALKITSVILYGPEIQYEIANKSNTGTKAKITNCPFLNRAKELGLESGNLYENCKAYNDSFIKNLNPKYTKTFKKAMCTGDEYCETSIELLK